VPSEVLGTVPIATYSRGKRVSGPDAHASDEDPQQGPEKLNLDHRHPPHASSLGIGQTSTVYDAVSSIGFEYTTLQ
jgi:hypothetical protein